MVLKNSKTACFSAFNLYDRVVEFFLPRFSVDAPYRATRSYSETVIDRGRLGLGIWITAVLTFYFKIPNEIHSVCFGTARTYASTYLLSGVYFVCNILFRFTAGSWFKCV
jgi:hypothetical protein